MELFKRAKDKEGPDLQEAWKKWNEGNSEQGYRKLMQAAEPTIQSAVTTFAGKKDDPVINLQAKNLAHKAFQSYDPEKAKLSTHLYQQLQPLKRTVHERANYLNVSPRAWWDLQNVEKVEEEYEDETGEPPSTQELAERTGLSNRRIEWLRQFRKGGIPAGLLEKQDPEALSKMRAEAGEENKMDTWTRAVYQTLDPRDQKIFEMRTGAFGREQLPNKEIAKRLGISASAVTQRANKIAEKIERSSNNAG